MCEARFKDKIVLVTGGAQGVGEAICRRFAEECATVIVADINEDGAKSVAENIAKEFGGKTLGIRMNVTDDFEVHSTMEMIEKDFGRLDVLVANAGILRAHAIEEFPVSEWRMVVEVNLVGYMICTKHACQIMMKQKSGNIVQINSKSGKKGSFRNSAYTASSFGGIGLTQSLALEMAPYGVRVNSVCPGDLGMGASDCGLSKYTDQIPLERSCSYDDITNVVTFLASDQAAYMTGQAINVTGGQEMR
ncbi:MAG: SDR family NAD(P)-dependent oxidoreductase [Armatimonadota bacterium]|nr:SDR family NAD(P)-dependent oxidoreductase [bacterium]